MHNQQRSPDSSSSAAQHSTAGLAAQILQLWRRKLVAPSQSSSSTHRSHRRQSRLDRGRKSRENRAASVRNAAEPRPPSPCSFSDSHTKSVSLRGPSEARCPFVVCTFLYRAYNFVGGHSGRACFRPHCDEHHHRLRLFSLARFVCAHELNHPQDRTVRTSDMHVGVPKSLCRSVVRRQAISPSS